MRYINSLKWDVKFPMNMSIFLGKGAIPSTKSLSQEHSEVINHSLKLMAMVVLQGPFYINSQLVSHLHLISFLSLFQKNAVQSEYDRGEKSKR